MNVIYLRTFFVSYVLFIALCVTVIAPLWWYNRKRSPEIALWLIDYILQFMGLLLITLRDVIPDFFSIIVADIFLIGGTIILYIGLGRYVKKNIRQFHNYIMLAVFTAVQTYFTYIYPDGAWRTINLCIALFYICAQASWLMLRGADRSLRSATRTTGIVFAFFCLVSVVQVIVNLIVPETHTFIVSNLFGIFAVMMYQILFVALTFALFLMVSRRLSIELEKKRLQREQEGRIIRTRLSLLEFAMTHSLDEVLQKTLDEVGDLVESPIGFYHFVEEDQKTLSLQAWSTRTLNEFCKAEGKGMHYAIDQAGVWTDCVLQKRAVIHNDYLSLPHRKGMPEGHAAVIRELVVPIMRGGKVMAILGVGNKPSDYDEEDMNTVSVLADVAWEITRRKKAEEQIKHLATHDLLTDLPSLRLAKDRLSSALNLARRYKKGAAVMFIDLDGFKSVNDTLGHDVGDYVLKEVARRLLSSVRETDTVARVGGDEFLIIATEIQSPDNAAQIAEKVIRSVSQPIIINGRQATVGTSIGISLFPDHSEDMDNLIKLADEAMYKVKNAGKNNYRFVNS